VNKFKVSNETLVGAFATITIAILLLGYNFLKGEELFTTTTNYYVSYHDALGLQSSAAVMHKGIKVGSVRKIQFRNDLGGVMVQFYVNDKVKLPKGSEVRLISTDLFNTRALEIVLATQTSSAYHTKNDTLIGVVSPGLLDKFGDEFSPLVSSLNQLIDSLRMSIEPQKIRGTVNNLEQTTESLNALLSDKNSQLNKILRDIASISSNLKANNETLSAAMANVHAITDSLAKANLTQTLAQAHASLEQTTEIMRKINTGEGSIGLLLNDKALYQNLNKSAADLDSLVIDLKANPKRYVHFSVFGKK
jgi:phospholipid/cholesterol/gamma-HCH transport system substrate-binding protein